MARDFAADAGSTRTASARACGRAGVRLSVGRLRINQRIAQAAIRPEAELRPRVEAATG